MTAYLFTLFALQLAPGPITGRLIDASTGMPLAASLVVTAGSTDSARTGQDGRFVWAGRLTFPATFIVILPDGRASMPVTVSAADASAEICLAINRLNGEAITVTGVAAGIDNLPASSVSTITTADLEARRPMTLAQAIEDLPGAGTVSDGQNLTPSLRGLARGRTLLLVDGARVSSERGAGPNASFVDPATLARVDVSRGPGAVAYGTDTFGGVIAAHTRGPNPRAGLTGRASLTVGAGLPERRGDVEVAQGYGSGGVLVAGRVRDFGDYSSPSGVVPYSSWHDAGGRLAWSHTQGSSQWSAGFQADEAREIGRPRNDSNVTVGTSPFERSKRFTASMTRAEWSGWRDLRITGLLGATQQRTEQDRLAAPGRPRRGDRADATARDFQVRITARRSVGAGRLRAGVDTHGRFAVRATDSAFIYNNAGALTSTQVTESIGEAQRTLAGGFVDAELPLRSWARIAGGARVESSRSRNSGGFFGDRRLAHTPAAGALSLIVTPDRRVTIAAQASRGFREPTLTDLYGRAPVGRGFVEGNPLLQPEVSRQFDVTAQFVSGRLQASAAIYRYSFRDLIERYSAGADLFRIRNRGRSRIEGLEFEARVDLGSLTVDLIAQASRGRDTTDGARLDDIAPPSIATTLRYVWRSRVRSFVRVARVADDEWAGPSEVPAPGYTMIDAGATWHLSRAVDVRATGRNLLNASIHASASPRWVWAPGRQVGVTLVVNLAR